MKRAKKGSNVKLLDLANSLRIAFRSIIRDFNVLIEPLPVDEVSRQKPNDAKWYRVRGSESYEELKERVIEFSGRVWQLKDGLINWLETQPDLNLVAQIPTGEKIEGKGGSDARQTIEDMAKLSMPLMLCADLYNSYKHYANCNRSKYQPVLSGVQFQIMGEAGIRYDGARKIGELLVKDGEPVKFRVEILSGNSDVNLGDAVVNAVRAFVHWIPLVQNMNLLSPDSVEDKAILDDLAMIHEAAPLLNAFDDDTDVINVGQLSATEQQLAKDDPSRLLRSLRRPE